MSVAWQGEPISVVSLGCTANLNDDAQAALQAAQVVIGAPHHFTQLGALVTPKQRRYFPSPFSELAKQLAAVGDKKIAVLASGDALFYGVGRWLIRHVGAQNCRFFANYSSVQAAFHAIAKPWDDAQVVSLHGRPMSHLKRHLQSGITLALLTDQRNHPGAIASTLQQLGFAQSICWVCENLGTEQTKTTRCLASELQHKAAAEFAELNVVIVDVQGYHPAYTAGMGIADSAFSTGAEPGYGMISKREVRMAILALLEPCSREVAWDLGAGCGSVSVEWARLNARGRIYAVESAADRCQHIAINAERFGVEDNLHIVHNKAPEACAKLPTPQSIFIGGSAGDLAALMDYAWQRLPSNGKLVVSAVTDANRRLLEQRFASAQEAGLCGELVQMQVSKSMPNGQPMRALQPVSILQSVKA